MQFEPMHICSGVNYTKVLMGLIIYDCTMIGSVRVCGKDKKMPFPLIFSSERVANCE